MKFSSSKDAAALDKRLRNSNVGRISGAVRVDLRTAMTVGDFASYVDSLSAAVNVSAEARENLLELADDGSGTSAVLEEVANLGDRDKMFG